MSLVTIRDLRCDICQHAEGFMVMQPSTVAELRSAALADGWMRKRVDGRLADVCAKCVHHGRHQAHLSDLQPSSYGGRHETPTSRTDAASPDLAAARIEVEPESDNTADMTGVDG